MSKDAVAFLGFIAFCSMLIFVGIYIASDYWKLEAIYHGAAHYDSKTAEFTWNNEVTP